VAEKEIIHINIECQMRIDHVALFCKDLEQMRQFFLDYFEAVSNEQYHNPRTGLRTYILTFSNGDTQLELMQRSDTIDADPSKPNVGFIHISFAVGSKEAVDAKTQELRNAGYHVTSGPRTTGDGYYESCILGPEGIQIEITI
jgi:lactoylglutathione lyase